MILINYVEKSGLEENNLCDTNIFIEYFNGDEKIIPELDYLGFERLSLSVVSVAEIYFGMRKKETQITRELLRKFNLIHLDKETSQLFVQFMLGFKKKGLKFLTL